LILDSLFFLFFFPLFFLPFYFVWFPTQSPIISGSHAIIFFLLWLLLWLLLFIIIIYSIWNI
jgi:hypothetical protein